MNTETIDENVAVLNEPRPLKRSGMLPRALDSAVLNSDRDPAAAPSAVAEVGSCPTHQELWDLYHRQGDIHTENALVESYLPLVRAVLNRLAINNSELVDVGDLHSAGLVGLLQALRNFNPASGVPFESYARHRIRGAIFDELRRIDWVPRSIHEKSKKVQAFINRLEQRYGRTPTDRELARAMEMTVTECRELLQEIRPLQFIHIDADVNLVNDDSEDLHEVFAASDAEGTVDQVSRRELQQVIFARLKEMPKIQCQVLTLYYIEDLNLREIATVLKLTESRICQLHSQAISAIRAYLQRYENGTAV